VAPETVKPVPSTVAALTVTDAVPVEVRVTDCVAGEFKFTSPNAMLVALMVNVGVNGPTCRVNVFEAPPALAVSITVCAVLTDVTVAEKLAVVAPAGTVTVAGTVTAELLLPRLTASPPVTAAEVRVTAQLSVPAVVIELLEQLTELSVGA
jgi:hypothetical protein